MARGRCPAEARREVRRETVAGDGVMGSGAEVEAAVAASKIARARRGSRSARTRRWRWSAVRVFGHLGGVGLAGGMGGGGEVGVDRCSAECRGARGCVGWKMTQTARRRQTCSS